MTRPRQPTDDATHYINVDLDILSAVALESLVQAMGRKVIVLYVGGKRRKFEAHLELASSRRGLTADRTILGLVDLIERLPPRYRRIWDRARSREFNVGIQAGLGPHAFEFRLKQRTIEAMTAVRGTLVVTVYAPDLTVVSVSRLRRMRGGSNP